MIRFALSSVLLFLIAAPSTWAADPRPAASAAGTSRAIFAGGCFWSAESAFEGLPGVASVVSGYTGGTVKNPSYDDVCSGTTGHAEAVEIRYDPSRISYGQLLDVFWHNIDPTQVDQQFCDRGHQYRSGIYYLDADQKRLAEASRRRIESTPQRFKGPIATEITAATAFYPAEEYHQDFYRKNPGRYGSYRVGCRRDARLTQLWGKPGRQGHAP
jgi:peptide-methionine (S)-S-oxide reductase